MILEYELQPNTAAVKVAANDTVSGDYFGSAVAIDGNVLVVGAYNQDSARGAAYIFEWDGSAWVQQAKFVGPNTAAEFGRAVAMSNGTVVVGAYRSTDVETYDGAVYIYTKVAGTWTQLQRILSPSPTWYGGMGRSVAIDGDLLAIGEAGQAASATGWAHVYRRSAGVWAREAELVAPDVAITDRFGTHIGISGSTVVVGSSQDDDAGNASGSAYVFDHAGGISWPMTQKLTASNAATSSQFGTTVGIHNGIIAVAAPYAEIADNDSGVVYIFQLSGGVWIERQLCVATGVQAQDHLVGLYNNLAVLGDTVLVGARGAREKGVTGAGAVYTFLPNTTWSDGYKSVVTHQLYPRQYSYFGHSVAYDGTNVVVGAVTDDGFAISDGCAYVFAPEVLGSSASTAAYLMQAADSITGAMHYWTSTTPDWAAAGYPGPNAAVDVAVAGRTRETG